MWSLLALWMKLVVWLVSMVVGCSFCLRSICVFPLGASSKTKSIWNGIVEKIECCLAGWKKLCQRVIGLH
jgi:hypothetical protein